ncbi:response regulator [Aeoliella sp.]|uniref:response regulator n=1 Tax=Aeoliella sp. TaxID=2795800 RepID=UPI003CCC4277
MDRDQLHDFNPAQDVDLRHSAVYLIDGKASDYTRVKTGLEGTSIRLQHFGTASQALRIPPYQAPYLYLVNVSLEDMSGFDLYSMLVERWPQVPGYMISDAYNAEDEIRARCAGSTLYFCKPLAEGWLAAAMRTNAPQHVAEELTHPNPALLWQRAAVPRRASR